MINDDYQNFSTDYNLKDHYILYVINSLRKIKLITLNKINKYDI